MLSIVSLSAIVLTIVSVLSHTGGQASAYNFWANELVAPEPPNEQVKMWITSEHNRYRRMIPATNMRLMYWSEELARSAQYHANHCDFRHSRGRVNVGENIWGAGYTYYQEALSIWFNEGRNPYCYGNTAWKAFCGHFFQMVWADSNLIGCGFARCTWRNSFVCHYAPRGNTIGRKPAYIWTNNDSDRCRDCPPDAPACHEGLCYMPNGYQQRFNGTASTTIAPKTSTDVTERTTTVEEASVNSTVAKSQKEKEVFL
ncbi:LON-1 protein [Aphelenchoides avenae]|nr:LON-1 protein [Aphelenchus avenae]